MTIMRRGFKSALPVAATCAAALLLAGCFNKSADISAYLARAQEAIDANQPAKAKLELQEALRLKPADPVANLKLAKIEDASGDISNAVPHYLRAAAPEARQLEAQLRVIEILLDSNRFPDALGRINATLGSFPGNPQALALRADLEERQNQDVQARNDVSAVLQAQPLDARALTVAALLALKAKNGNDALALVTKGLAAHPKDLRLMQVQAAALLTLDQPEKAIAALKSIVSVASGSVSAQVALADIETQNGHFDEAFQGLKEAVAANPANQDLKLAVVGFLARNKKDSSLVSFLQSEIASDPKSSTYDLLLAEYYRSIGQLGASEQTLQKAADRLGAGADGDAVRVAMAKLSILRGDERGAMARLDDVLATRPDDKDALLTRAVLQMNNGQVGAAVDDASKVTRADPVNGQAYEILANAYMQLGAPKLATEAMRRATAVLPGNDSAQMRLAAFLQQAGDQAGARDIAARLTLAHPEADDIWIAAARLAIERHDWTLAASTIAHIQDLPGKADVATILRGQMEALKGNPAKAAAEFRSVLDKASSVDPSVIAAFASASVAQKQSDAASAYLKTRIPAFDEAAKIAAWTSIMTMQADAGHFDQASDAYRQIVALAPTDLAALQIYVRILALQHDYAQAETVVAAAEKAGAPAASCALLRGGIQEAKGDIAAAEASYRDAYKANPLSVPALNNYASIAADRDAKNVALLEQLRGNLSGLEPSADPSLVDTIAWLDYRLGRLDEAKALLARIHASTSDNPQLRFHAAAVAIASGDKQAGMEILATLKDKTFPGDNEAREMMAM